MMYFNPYADELENPVTDIVGRIGDIYFLEGSLDSAVKLLSKYLMEYPNAEIEFVEERSDFGDTSTNIQIINRRPPTEEELQERKDRIQKQEEVLKRIRLDTFRALQREFKDLSEDTNE